VEYLTEADWRWVFDVNFFGVVALTQAATPLLRSGHGRIAHIGSMAGRMSSPGLVDAKLAGHIVTRLPDKLRDA
jgi:NAD(P)-dependent dehydrogenase (short-subunit alcohol dehydrogenase family)